MDTSICTPTAQELGEELRDSTPRLYSGVEWIVIAEPLGGGWIGPRADDIA